MRLPGKTASLPKSCPCGVGLFLRPVVLVMTVYEPSLESENGKRASPVPRCDLFQSRRVVVACGLGSRGLLAP